MPVAVSHPTPVRVLATVAPEQETAVATPDLTHSPQPVVVEALGEAGPPWGVIIIIVVGVLGALAAGTAAAWWFLWRPQREEQALPSGGPDPDELT